MKKVEERWTTGYCMILGEQGRCVEVRAGEFGRQGMGLYCKRESSG